MSYGPWPEIKFLLLLLLLLIIIIIIIIIIKKKIIKKKKKKNNIIMFNRSHGTFTYQIRARKKNEHNYNIIKFT